jgi:hypothetical protein
MPSRKLLFLDCFIFFFNYFGSNMFLFADAITQADGLSTIVRAYLLPEFDTRTVRVRTEPRDIRTKLSAPEATTCHDSQLWRDNRAGGVLALGDADLLVSPLLNKNGEPLADNIDEYSLRLNAITFAARL